MRDDKRLPRCSRRRKSWKWEIRFYKIISRSSAGSHRDYITVIFCRQMQVRPSSAGAVVRGDRSISPNPNPTPLYPLCADSLFTYIYIIDLTEK